MASSTNTNGPPDQPRHSFGHPQGTIAHSMAFLALALVNNVQLADADPNADSPTDDVPRAQLSLLCVVPASASNGRTNGTAPSGQDVSLNGRAPP